jgi:hypothetical protein
MARSGKDGLWVSTSLSLSLSEKQKERTRTPGLLQQRGDRDLFFLFVVLRRRQDSLTPNHARDISFRFFIANRSLLQLVSNWHTWSLTPSLAGASEQREKSILVRRLQSENSTVW